MRGKNFVRAGRGALLATLALTGSAGVFAERRGAQAPTAPLPSSQTEAELQTGIALTRSGKFPEAIPHFLAARGQVSENYAVEFNLALCYVGTSEFQKAIPIVLALRNQGHENADVENLLSQAYAGNDQPKEAFRAFQTAAAFTPNDEKLYLLVAAAFLEKGEYSPGYKVVKSGLERLPDSPRLHYEMGYTLWQLDESGLAKQEFERASSLAPHATIGYLATAQESFMLGNLLKATETARAGIHEGFADYQLLALLGDALIHDGASPGKPGFVEAKEALLKSIAMRPNYASSQIALGGILLQEGQEDAAIEHLEFARRLAPGNPTPCMLLARAYRKRGRPEQARAMLAMVAKINEQQAEKRKSAFEEER